MAACGDDASAGGPSGNSGGGGSSGLVGKWYFSQELADAGAKEYLIWEFTSDGKAIYAGRMTYTYTATSDTISVSVQGNFIGTRYYTISGTALKITDPENKGGIMEGTFYKPRK